MAKQKTMMCDVFKSPNKEGMYLYVQQKDCFSRVPDSLLEKFGEPVKVITLKLKPDKPLGKVCAERVMNALDLQGFYLQLPDLVEDEMQTIAQRNTKL